MKVSWNRREFLSELKDRILGIYGVLSLPFLSGPLSGCGVEVSGGQICNSTSISGHEGHSVSLTNAQISAGEEMSFSIQGSSDHDHTITITAAQFQALASGDTLDIESTETGGHTHTIRFRC